MDLLKALKREIFITILTIIGLTITFFGVTYAIYFTIDEKNIGQISVGQIGFDMCIDDSCTGYGTTYGTTIVGEIYPMSDAEGVAQTPYRFKMTTNSEECMNSKIYAAINDDIDYDHVRYAVRMGSSGAFTYGDFSDGPTIILYENNCWQFDDDDYILELYVWLDEYTGNDMIGQNITVFVNALGYYKPSDPNNLHTGDTIYANVDDSVLKSEFVYDPTMDYQTFTAPMNGYYYIQAIGADCSQVVGDYVSGYVYLNKNENLYLYMGDVDDEVSTSVRYYSTTPTASQLEPYGSGGLTPAAKAEILVASYGDGDESVLSGYPGSSFPDSNGMINNLNRSTLHYSGKYFINPKIVYYDGGQQEPGKVFISYAGPMQRVNTKLNNVRYIKDCINGNSVNTYNRWGEIQAMKDGENIALNKTVTGTVSQYSSSYPYSKIVDGVSLVGYGRSSLDGLQCVTIDLGSTYNLDEIAVWHYFTRSDTVYNNNITSVSSNNSTWTEVINKQKPETSYGKSVSAY